VKKPVLQDHPFLADVAAAHRDEKGLHVWWLGQSGFLLQWHGKHLLFDPYLSDSLTVKYANTQKPHVRMTERVIAPQKLTFIDVVTSSHNHTDHLDADTLRPLLAANPKLKLVIPSANYAIVADRLQIDPSFPIGFRAGERRHIAGMAITAVPAAHDHLDPAFLGYVVRLHPWTIYHSGDTVRYEGMSELLLAHKIDLAFLPINGMLGNMDGPTAAQLAKDADVKLAIPCHFDMFEFNTAAPDAFVAECRRIGQPFRVLKNGERTTLSLKANESH
jgi:L-ascorbate metabolism protein UlaG (beta-lactamase superfamily)